MTDRTIATVARPSPEPGTGILRPFPSRELRNIDPFVFLDTGAPLDLGTNDIFVGPHPHRGVQPVGILFRGRVEHRDSLGNRATVRSGGMQWLVAGSGALHEETLSGDDDCVFHMAQLWVNLPERLKSTPPEHHAVDARDVPELRDLGRDSVVRLYAGELEGRRGPAPLSTPVLIAHIAIGPGGAITVPVPEGWTAAYCVVAGEATSPGSDALPAGATPVLNDDGAGITVRSRPGAEVLLMCGEPLGEPVATGGGFVMNTPAEIEAAFGDYRSGKMGSLTSPRVA